MIESFLTLFPYFIELTSWKTSKKILFNINTIVSISEAGINRQISTIDKCHTTVKEPLDVIIQLIKEKKESQKKEENK